MTSVRWWLNWLFFVGGVTALVSLTAVGARGQDYFNATGKPTFATLEPVDMGFTNLANGNLHLQFLEGSPAQRSAHPASFVLTYNSNLQWSIFCGITGCSWFPQSNAGGPGSTGPWNSTDGSGDMAIYEWTCPNGGYCAWVAEDFERTRRYFSFPPSGSTSSYAWDSSGYLQDISGVQSTSGTFDTDGASLGGMCIYVSGSDPSCALNTSKPSYLAYSMDRNGNYWQVYCSQYNACGHVTDTLGRQGILSSNGQARTYTTTTTSIPVSTNFGQSGVSEYSQAVNVVQTLTLPDGSTYNFKYDCDLGTGNAACGSPSGQPGYYGLLISMTLPTLGTVQFGWTTFSDSYGNKRRWLTSRTSGGGTWTYSPTVVSTCGSTQVGCLQQVTVNAPDSSQRIYTYTLNNGAWPTIEKFYGTNGSLLATITNSFDFSNACVYTGCIGAAYIRLLATQTAVSVPSGTIAKQTAYSYDSPQLGDVTAVQEWGFQPGTYPSFSSTPDRATYTPYVIIGNNIHRPQRVTVCNNSGSDSACTGGGSRVAQTLYTYDSYGSNCPSGGLSSVTGIINHYDNNFGAAFLQRGNPTSIQNFVGGSTNATTQLCYDTTGRHTAEIDPNGNKTQFSYSDNFYQDSSPAQNPPSSFAPPGPTNAFPTAITPPLIGTGTLGYYYGSGKPAFSADQNAANTYLHYLDPLDRLTHTFSPLTNGNRGWTLTTYSANETQTDTYSAVTTTSPSSSCTSCVHNTQNLDSFGRPIQSTLANDPDGATYQLISYDSSGRTYSVTNPYRTSSDATYGVTYFVYDGLGRLTGVVDPDSSGGSSVPLLFYGAAVASVGAGGISSQLCAPGTYGYGYPALQIDEAGNKKQTWANAFGETIEVDEPDSSANPTLGTCYAHDALGNLTSVVQMGGTTNSTQWRTRSFTYDGLSRLVSATEPESGTTTYTYDANGNLLTKTSPSGAPSPGGGSATVSGSEQSIAGAPAAPGTGSVTFSGSLQSKQVQTQAATHATGYVTISGAEQATDVTVVPPCESDQDPNSCQPPYTYTVYDAGGITVTVNGHSDTAGYGQLDTTSTIATSLANAINSDAAASVAASASGGTVYLTSKGTGPGSDFSLSSSYSYDNADFLHGSFTTSNSGTALTGGQNAVYTTVYDSGTCTITANSYGDAANWNGSGTTSSSIASALASKINGDSSASVSASVSGSTVNLAAKTTGAGTNYGLSASCSYDTSNFSSPSFTTSNSGSALTGGHDQGAATYDSGNVWVTVNGTEYSVGYSQSSSSSSLASALASAISAGSLVNASASGSVVSITADGAGGATDYSLSSGSSTSQPGSFSAPSFAVSVSGSSLTGGTNSSNQTVTISYCYDALNRPTAKAYTYSPNAPPSCSGTPPTFPSPVTTYFYDQGSFNGLTITNGIGRLTGMTDAAGSEAWSYDAQGNVLADLRTTNGVSKQTSYAYNLDGSLASVTYPSARTVTYATSPAGRAISAIDTASGINYATGAHYSPAGDLASIQNGANITSSYIFQNRFQPCWLYTTTSTALAWNSTNCAGAAPGANILDVKLNFNLGSGDNGNLISITNNRDNTRSQNFAYDHLNRLLNAQTQTTGVTIPNSNCWGLTFGYDSWGNLLSSTTTGPSGCAEPLPVNVSITASNQISGYCYDARGNLLDQGPCPGGAHTYSYTAENQLASTAGVSYTYDGDGRRVMKSNGKLYWYGAGSVPLDETDSTGNTTNSSFFEYVFFGGQRIARRDYQNNVNYYFADHLGTSRVVTNSSGAILDDSDFYPFGGERPVTSSSGNTYKFTGYEHDAESGLEYASARHFSSTLGRFISPDPLSGSPGNPQSWNRYSYVYNNPLNTTDPLGMCPPASEDTSDCGDANTNWDSSWNWVDFGAILSYNAGGFNQDTTFDYAIFSNPLAQPWWTNPNAALTNFPQGNFWDLLWGTFSGWVNSMAGHPTVSDPRFQYYLDQQMQPRSIKEETGRMIGPALGFLIPGGAEEQAAVEGIEAAEEGPVIIGETMARVEAAAQKIPGAIILNDMPDFAAMGMEPHEVTGAMMQYNRQWLLRQLRSGRQIIDIGSDPNRAVPSIFYQMEKNMITNYAKLHPERVIR